MIKKIKIKNSNKRKWRWKKFKWNFTWPDYECGFEIFPLTSGTVQEFSQSEFLNVTWITSKWSNVLTLANYSHSLHHTTAPLSSEQNGLLNKKKQKIDKRKKRGPDSEGEFEFVFGYLVFHLRDSEVKW